MKILAQRSLKVAEEDQSDDFSREKPVTYVGPPRRDRRRRAHLGGARARAVGAVRGQAEILDSQVTLQVVSDTRWIVNSEGTLVQSGRNYVRVSAEANARADDGMELERVETFDAATFEALPSVDVMARAVDTIITDLKALRHAPLADPFIGPAILEGRAAGVFFHEIFGHRVEGHRQKNDDEGQTFAKKIGQPIMPSFISVYDDPTLARIGDTDLNGFYRFDDEGVPAQRATLVDGGVLKTFLLSRSPTRGFEHSNGHGRRQEGRVVVSRQGNLVVEPRVAVPVAELRRRLRAEAQRQGKPYGLLFRDISGGFTNTTRGGPQAFKVLPILVYRVWVDGRPDQLVRGVDLVGTPLTALSKILAASDDYQTFNGYCGAESGFVPVSATSPSLLVEQIRERAARQGQRQAAHLVRAAARALRAERARDAARGEAVRAPAVIALALACVFASSGAVRADVRVDPEAVRAALRDELARSTAELHLGDEPRPYYLAYTVSDCEQATVSATFGALTASHAYQGRLLRTDVRVGSPAFDNTNFEPGAKIDALPIEDDYASLRRELWLRTDEAYKIALELYARKRAAAAGQAAGDDDHAVGDFSKEPPARLEVPFPAGQVEPEALRAAVVKLSAIFRDYPAIASARVTGTYAVVHRRMASTEGTWIDDAQRTVRIDVTAETQAADGMKLRDFVPFSALVPDGPADAARDGEGRARHGGRARRHADGARGRDGRGGRAVRGARGRAAHEAAARRPPRGHAGAQDGVGRRRRQRPGERARQQAAAEGRVAAPVGRRRSFDDDGPRQGAGHSFGAYRVDDEGVPAQRVSLVEHGVLEALLMTRTPRKEHCSLQWPRACAALRGAARAPRHAHPHGAKGRWPAAQGAARRARAHREGRRRHDLRRAPARRRAAAARRRGRSGCRCSRSAAAATAHRPCARWSSTASTAARRRWCAACRSRTSSRARSRTSRPRADAIVYNYVDEGSGFSGIPTTIIAPSLLVSDVDIRRVSGRTASRRSTRRRWPGIEVRYERRLGSTSRSMRSTRWFQRWSGSSSTCSSCVRGCARSRSKLERANVRMSREETQRERRRLGRSPAGEGALPRLRRGALGRARAGARPRWRGEGRGDRPGRFPLGAAPARRSSSAGGFGEKKVGFWHPVDGGFASRRPVDAHVSAQPPAD